MDESKEISKEELIQKREELWRKFVLEYIKPLKDYNFPKIENDGFTNYKIIIDGDDKKPTFPEEMFIRNLVYAQENKPALLPYLWVLAISPKTFTVSEYCKKRLKKFVIANGADEYWQMDSSIELSDEMSDTLDDAKLTSKQFIEVTKKIIEGYKIEKI